MDVVDNQNYTLEEGNYFFLKGRFKSNSLGFYGIFLLIFNTRQELEVNHVLVSTFSSAFDMEPYIGWEQYEEFIVNSKWKGSYNPNLTVSIEEIIKKIASGPNAQLERLYEYLINYDYDSIDDFIMEILNRIIHDKHLILETNIQESTETEFTETKGKIKAEKSDKQAGDSRTTVKDGVTLMLQLILAPVSGKPIYELKIGDIIMCKIIPNTDQANYFIDLLNLRDDNTAKPAPCKVIDIKSEGKGHPLEILTELGPGIYGKCIEDERQVKLRLYDPAVDGRLLKRNKSDVRKDAKRQSSILGKRSQGNELGLARTFYIAISVFVVIVFLVLAFYILNM